MKKYNKKYCNQTKIQLAFLYLSLISFIPFLFFGCQLQNSTLSESEKPMSLEEKIYENVKKMNLLGITEANEEIAATVFQQFQSFPEDLQIAENATEEQINGMIFNEIGLGAFDYEKQKYFSTSNQIYAFDTEVFSVSDMYTQFLAGVLSLTGDELIITDIKEDTSKVNYEVGNGIQTIYFTLNGHAYQLDATVYYDWFDVNIIHSFNEILSSEGINKRLWYTTDGWQGCVIFYNTQEWANQFEKIMGYPFAS